MNKAIRAAIINDFSRLLLVKAKNFNMSISAKPVLLVSDPNLIEDIS